MEFEMHLTDCFMDLVAYVVYFQRTVETKQPSYEQTKSEILRHLAQSEHCLKKGFFTQEDYDQARFMICAWVDETILNSAWNQKSKWQTEQLQRLYYNVTDAGKTVFERLNSLGLHQREVREVYYLCLALGFMGRYCQRGDEVLLEQLKTSNLKLLIGATVGLPSLERMEFFPDAQPAAAVTVVPRKQRFRFSGLTLTGLIAPVALFFLLLLIYRFSLSGIGENILRMIP
jgi:type VI secretion system protein ImpK